MNNNRALLALKIPFFALRGFPQTSGLCFNVLYRQPLKLRCPSFCGPIRYNTTDVAPVDSNTGVFKKFLRSLGWLDHSKARLKVSGCILYENIADRVQYHQFFKEFNMPDTFFSWFIITELHVWMLLVRTMNEGEEGRFLRNCVVEAMWHDVTTRAKKLGAANPSSVRHQVHELSQQFQAALIGYDEGLLSDDKVLAGALWRRFFQRSCNQPEDIEVLVHFIRKQVTLLDKLHRDEILLKPNIIWVDFLHHKTKT